MALTETSPEEVASAPAREEPHPPAPSVGGGAAANDHKVVGSAYLAMALAFLVAGGVLALLMRAQLASPDGDLFSDRQYRTLFTFHGTFLVFLFLLPAWIGLATAVVPLQVGAARLAFPRAQTFALWLTLVGGGLVVASAIVTGGQRLTSGWALSSPIPEGSAFPGQAVEFLVLGLALVAGAAVLAVANLMVTIIKLRAPGLTARRLPLFSWSVLVGGAVLLLALPVLIAGFGMLYVDHHFGAHLFSGLTSNRGGNPLLWPRLFWFGAYPMLWALLVLALGVVSEIIPVFARRPIADRTRAMAALAAIGVLAFAGWGSEVRNLTGGRPLFVLGALAVLAPLASVFVNWLLTLRLGAKEHGASALRAGLQSPPMLLVLGLLSVLAAGLAASVPSAIDASRDLHGNYWQVGQQHLLFFAPATLAIVAAIHYWGPKVWGRSLSDGMGKLEVLLLAGGAHLAFLPALILGLQHMPLHASSYGGNQDWRAANLAMGIGGAVFTLGVVVFVLNLAVNVGLRRGKPADPDPWGGHTLEWTAPTPLPRHNFDRLVEVRSATPALDRRSAAVGAE